MSESMPGKMSIYRRGPIVGAQHSQRLSLVICLYLSLYISVNEVREEKNQSREMSGGTENRQEEKKKEEWKEKSEEKERVTLKDTEGREDRRRKRKAESCKESFGFYGYLDSHVWYTMIYHDIPECQIKCHLICNDIPDRMSEGMADRNVLSHMRMPYAQDCHTNAIPHEKERHTYGILLYMAVSAYGIL